MTHSTASKSEKELLHEKGVSMAREGRKFEIRLEALEAQIKKLQLQKKVIKAELELNKKAATDNFLTYVKKECLELSDKVRKKLPREIRDIIYGYITYHGSIRTPNGWRWAAPTRITEAYFRTQSETQLRTANDKVDKDHWWNPDFVGADMVREIGENYYRSSYFYFGDEFEIIPRFRATDQWKLGFLPVSYVSAVEIAIDWTDCYFELRNVDDAFGGLIKQLVEIEEGARLRDNEAKLLVQLESLFGFRPGTAVTITIKSHPSDFFFDRVSQKSVCENTMPLIFPVLERLKDTGCRARVILESKYELEWMWGTFVSEWNPVSFEAFKKAFSKHSSDEEASRLRCKLHQEAAEDFDMPY